MDSMLFKYFEYHLLEDQLSCDMKPMLISLKLMDHEEQRNGILCSKIQRGKKKKKRLPVQCGLKLISTMGGATVARAVFNTADRRARCGPTAGTEASTRNQGPYKRLNASK